MGIESATDRILRPVFFGGIKLAVAVLLGMHVRRRHLLPERGPAIIVANHNSHLDTLALLSLFPLRRIKHVHPVAAADYFLKNRLMRWFATRIIGIIPIERRPNDKHVDPLQPCCDALEQGKILILFPEGTRGEAERISEFKKGVFRLAARYPDVPVIPVFMHGFGKALPKGDWVLVPFFCDVFVGERIPFQNDRNAFMDTLRQRFQTSAEEEHFAVWE